MSQKRESLVEKDVKNNILEIIRGKMPKKRELDSGESWLKRRFS